LDAATAALFLVFAILLYRSAPGANHDGLSATDGGVVGAVPDVAPNFEIGRFSIGGPVGRFLSIFSLMAVGEFGDKTQLITIGLAAQYGANPAIWVGEMAAIIPVSLANAYFFHRFSHRFDLRKAHYVGAALFAFFGLDTVASITVGFSAWETIVGTVSQALGSLAVCGSVVTVRVFTVVRAGVRPLVVGRRQEELPDSRTRPDLDRVVDLEQPLAAPLVAGVPDGRLQRTAVAQQRRPWEDEPDVTLRNGDHLAVPDDVPTRLQPVQQFPLAVAVRLHLPAVADPFAVGVESPRLDRLEHRADGEIDTVGLDLVVSERVVAVWS
jgi:putative Ca2+/H+ antiporter (TMEM165/GDT1 family)